MYWKLAKKNKSYLIILLLTILTRFMYDRAIKLIEKVISFDFYMAH